MRSNTARLACLACVALLVLTAAPVVRGGSAAKWLNGEEDGGGAAQVDDGDKSSDSPKGGDAGNGDEDALAGGAGEDQVDMADLDLDDLDFVEDAPEEVGAEEEAPRREETVTVRWCKLTTLA